MPMDNQCRICGQLMGVVQFSFSMFNSYPAVFRFENEKFVVKHVGKYSFVSIIIDKNHSHNNCYLTYKSSLACTLFCYLQYMYVI